MSRFFTKKQRKELMERSEGKCEGTGPLVGLPEGVRCGRDLGSNWIADHIEPHECGGPTTLENGWALCVQCNVVKTGKGDIPRIAKNTRVREKRQGLRKSKGRPMDGTKRSKFRKGVSGKVERR